MPNQRFKRKMDIVGFGFIACRRLIFKLCWSKLAVFPFPLKRQSVIPTLSCLTIYSEKRTFTVQKQKSIFSDYENTYSNAGQKRYI